jgi:hypothetical protein
VRQFDRHILIEWRASAIDDPLERLRYLRLVTSPTRTIPLSDGARRLWLAGLAALALGILSGNAGLSNSSRPTVRPLMLPPPVVVSRSWENTSGVWLVDQRSGAETYSNGLRIDNSFAISNVPRDSYRVFERDHPDILHSHWKDSPAGIVFHTTESEQAPFEEGQNGNLQRISVVTLNHVRRNHSYHFFIDRFGRVFRVVNESDVAFHAGRSVWGDNNYVYVNLNSAFLGIALETQVKSDQALEAATSAQVDSLRVLTQMLRSRYGILDSNCVTHAQVSVNSSNMLIGYHTDWADRFPFLEIGLKDNYLAPPASLSAFGFGYDPSYVQSTGARLLPALMDAEAGLKASAARLHLPLGRYRLVLQKNYKEITAVASSIDAAKETTNEQN